jgi:hypothetical protein
MKISEYRIVIPTAIEKGKIVNIFIRAAVSHEEFGHTKGEGIEFLPGMHRAPNLGRWRQ